jgi:hypothetical protein
MPQAAVSSRQIPDRHYGTMVKSLLTMPVGKGEKRKHLQTKINLSGNRHGNQFQNKKRPGCPGL